MKKILFLIILTFCILSCSTENPMAPKIENTSEEAFVDGYVTLYDNPIDAIVSVYYNGNFINLDGTNEYGYYRVPVGSEYNDYVLLVQCQPALKYNLNTWTQSIIFHCPSKRVDFPYPMP